MADDTKEPTTTISAASGGAFEAVLGRRKVRHYLISEHEMASLSIASGAAAFLLTLGLFFLGGAGAVWFGGQTFVTTGAHGSVQAVASNGVLAAVFGVLGVIFVAAAVILLMFRRDDVERIKRETQFPT
jgi:hypothetical protein